ncbi:Fic family protein [Raoultibacter phocaeensis]|uniref:Fic family protein n=1 Tax=Raoultibacter phocaeensis TaxID=2479841 RepID=UPI00111A8208|nr:Fic family protein [Raoultibacter phocaeensis]
MTADNTADFPYRPVDEPGDAATRKRYWATAIGLQKVDGLEPSRYLLSLAEQNASGELTLRETAEYIASYHSKEDTGDPERQNSREADLVSQRIVELLASRSFLFDPEMLSIVHAALFRDLDSEVYRPGLYKREALMKQEAILNGDSVVYGDPALIDRALALLFEREEGSDYGFEFDRERINRFSSFIAHLWQVHPFEEGNTRTVAVFAELYLGHLGFDVTNNPFEHHSKYFRDALVRANYRNAKAKIKPEIDYLALFFENLLCGATHTLDSTDLIVASLFDDPTLLRNVDPSQALNR